MGGVYGAPERKFHATGTLEVRGGAIEGYASLFGQRDQGGDVVRPGAYGASLAALGDRRVKMLWQHDASEPIGVWDEVREDAAGLFVKGRILPDVARGREAIALLDAGAIDGLSIGYRTVRAERDAKGRQLAELDLWEVSLVTFPMQVEARVQTKNEELGGMRHIAEMIRGMTAAIAAR
ncbi:HK97 family phage prohead protease [Falsirhodobacter sp. alg1]|uniref:HK97 family phage prohead protease n=1 Tax=Falsirhodobacter sp. alg1 TaxID=1472418 RepID=UPI0005F009DE|nr:HK97 family phage prohead protease [Falsirhodobacter sp. alg1]